MKFYTWTHQFWSTSKELHSFALCRHWMLFRGLAKIDDQRDGWRETVKGIRVGTPWWIWWWWCKSLLLLLLLFTPLKFFTSALADGLSLEFEWQQVSSSLQDSYQYSGCSQQCCNLDGLHSSSNFQIFQSLFYSPLVNVLSAPHTIGIILTFRFHSFFNSLASSRYLSFFSLSFSFILWLESTILFFLLIAIRCGVLAEIRWSVCMSKSHWSLCVSFSRRAAGLCIYYLFVWSNFNLFYISQWITLHTQSCLVLYSFCANLLHSLRVSIYTG